MIKTLHHLFYKNYIHCGFNLTSAMYTTGINTLQQTRQKMNST